MKITLTQGKFAIVDKADFDWLNRHKWYPCVNTLSKNATTHFASRTEYISYKATPQNEFITMHRVIMQARKGEEISHRNGNGLDNRRCNLRRCNHAQSQMNMRKSKNPKSSKYKGVSWNKRSRKWTSQIKKHGHLIHLGRFDDEVEAAKAYNKKARELFGEFARLNSIKDDWCREFEVERCVR